MGIRFFPITLGPMRMLTRRGMALASELRAKGIPSIEGYPGAAQDILGIPRKGESLTGLRRGLRALGLQGDILRAGLGHDELDAVTCAWIGRCFQMGDFLAVGDPREGWMVLPSKRRALERLRGRTPSRRRRSPGGGAARGHCRVL
jgi:predicted nuclease with RNAse H fold